jgi:hypothetical protein
MRRLQADQQYARKSQIESQARLQSIQDILAVRSLSILHRRDRQMHRSPHSTG